MAYPEEERRRYQRIRIPEGARLYATDETGRWMGPIHVLSRGGMFLTTRQSFSNGADSDLIVVDETDGIRQGVRVVARSVVTQGVGFEFCNMSPDAAAEIGVILGRVQAIWPERLLARKS